VQVLTSSLLHRLNLYLLVHLFLLLLLPQILLLHHHHFHHFKKIDVIVITSLVGSIITSSFFILYSPDKNIRDYNALLMSAISIGVALVIYLVQLFRYKNSIRKQHSQSKMSDKQPHYYDNNKMHISICLFLVLWLVAQLM
jgi:Ca2+/H+ antiporter